MSLGGSKSKQSSNQQQDQTSVSGQSIWADQMPFLTSLFGQAQNLQQQQQPTIRQRALEMALNASGVQTRSQRGYESVLDTGGGPLAQYAQPNNALAGQQLGHMSTQIGNEFQRVVMPALNSAAGVAGGRGGSRNQIARGLAASDAQGQIAKAGSDLYGTQYGIGAQAAAGSTQAMLDAAGGLGSLAPEIYNLGMSPFTAQWAPLTALAQILGNPQVLSASISRGASTGSSKGKSASASFGLF